MPNKLTKVTKQKRKERETEKKKLENFYTSGASAFNSAGNLRKESRLSRKQDQKISQAKGAHATYQQTRQKFTRLKVNGYDIDETYSIDLADVNNMANCNKRHLSICISGRIITIFQSFENAIKISCKSGPNIQRNDCIQRTSEKLVV